ncbi:hypothetical protein I4U23_003912 [Adineta vaga]|nr:hypothetical protein I4U23_003912 [Adineta vaga]
MATGAFGLRVGDWECSRCEFINFSSRPVCQRCGGSPYSSGSAPPVTAKPGDWECAACRKLNFAARQACFKCGNSKYSYATRTAMF